MAKIRIGGIIRTEHLAKVGVMSIPDRPGIAAAVLGALGRQKINVPFVVQCIDIEGKDHIVFCVDQDDLSPALKIVEEVVREIGAEKVVHHPEVAIVAIFGPDFRSRPNIAGTFFSALAAAGINVLAISTSISTLSCVIASDRVEDAVQAICGAFELP
ncbi:MAG: ACT domain-containing protein [Anaerolineae bacterium]